jgi:RNA polymerase sigma-70 factor (ECF subfamily)
VWLKHQLNLSTQENSTISAPQWRHTVPSLRNLKGTRLPKYGIYGIPYSGSLTYITILEQTIQELHTPPLLESAPAGPQAKYAGLVERVQRGHPAALEELYGLAKNFTYFLMRQLGDEDLLDKVHDIFVTVAQSIRAGKLRDPERLIPFLTTVTRFYTYNQIDRRVHRRKRCGPIDDVNPVDPRINLERAAYAKQRHIIAREILHSMPCRDRDVLERFYLAEQSKEQICHEMQLTPTQFRLLKSKAKATFTKIGMRRVQTNAA